MFVKNFLKCVCEEWRKDKKKNQKSVGQKISGPEMYLLGGKVRESWQIIIVGVHSLLIKITFLNLIKIMWKY